MTDQNRSKLGAYKSNCASISRRDVLRASATIIPASIIVPAWLTANAQTATTTFDYYISTTGSDSNPGTLSQPWSIKSLSGWTASQYAGSQFTAQSAANWAKLPGKRVGILPGVYDVSRLMYPAGIANGSAFQIPGGTSSAPSYWGSSDTNGQYSPRTATLDEDRPLLVSMHIRQVTLTVISPSMVCALLDSPTRACVLGDLRQGMASRLSILTP